jgi:GTPase SAR1 family protein
MSDLLFSGSLKVPKPDDRVQEMLIQLIRSQLTPIAQNWSYREIPLEQSIKGPPMVLILGNYSSGKSTLINELIRQEVQKTGQAPTDDSFTVLTYQEAPGPGEPAVREGEGHGLLHDDRYPFAPLKRHGQKFAAHFRMKYIHAPFLKNLMLIDTPGMIDSISERDRGYDYQQVIADLAQVADLVLVLFDPHKAGTLRESYESLRETLPQATFDNRVVFVLNRIDECQNLPDLLRVYGVLCWNLSQMLGRKDIPPIRLSYSHSIQNPPTYLAELEQERTNLGVLIASAPLLRQDHLKSFARLHAERLHFLVASLMEACHRKRLIVFSSFGRWTVAAVAAGIGVFIWSLLRMTEALDIAGMAGFGAFAIALLIWGVFIRPWTRKSADERLLKTMDQWAPIKNQNDRDNWLHVKPLVKNHLKTPGSKFKKSLLKKDLKALSQLLADGLKSSTNEVLN